jgi:hypothetical protein
MQHTRCFLRVSRLAGLFLLFFVMSFSAVPSARAATGDLTCAATLKVEFRPALGTDVIKKSYKLTGEVQKCTSRQSISPKLESGTIFGLGNLGDTPLKACWPGQVGGLGEGEITWNTGQKSQITFFAETDVEKQLVAYEMEIDSGPLKGDVTKVESFKAHLSPAACPTKYISEATSDPTTLSFK